MKAVRELKAAGLDSLLKTGAFSDFVIKGSGGREWKVHKAIICPQSDYFMRLAVALLLLHLTWIGAGLQSADYDKEAKTGSIDLSTDDGDALDALITYLYNGALSEAKSMAKGKGSLQQVRQARQANANHMLNIHTLADKYNIETLITLTADLFMQLAKESKFTTGFALLLTRVLEDTSPKSPLRKDMLDMIVAGLYHLLDVDDSGDEGLPALKAALVRYPEFAVSLLCSMSQM